MEINSRNKVKTDHWVVRHDKMDCRRKSKKGRGVLRAKVRLSFLKLNVSSSIFSPEFLLGTVQASSSARVIEQSSEEMPWWWAGSVGETDATFLGGGGPELVGWVRVTTHYRVVFNS
jgi:hypothetical protein